MGCGASVPVYTAYGAVPGRCVSGFGGNADRVPGSGFSQGRLLSEWKEAENTGTEPAPELSLCGICDAGIHAEMGCRYFEKRTEAECGAYLALSAVTSFP